MSVMFAFVGITTVFIVFVTFYMIISHKSKDIGILKSIGASNLDIFELFSGFSFLVGFVGSITGIFGGWLFLQKINQIEHWLYEHFQFQLWDRTIYAIGDIPNEINPPANIEYLRITFEMRFSIGRAIFIKSVMTISNTITRVAHIIPRLKISGLFILIPRRGIDKNMPEIIQHKIKKYLKIF